MRLTSTQQDYVETLLALSRESPEGVALSALAAALGVKPPTAVQAVAALRKHGMAAQEPRGKITLTEAGCACAEQVAATHETLRVFLNEVLNVPSATADRDACSAEHALSPETVFRLREFLAHIAEDAIEKDGTVSLTLLARGTTGVLKRITGATAKVRRLAAMGVRNGARIRVLQNAGDGPVMIQADKSRIALGRSIATCLHVLTDPPADKLGKPKGLTR